MQCPTQYCFWCRRDFSPDQLTRDHVHPRGMGGSDASGNIVMACQVCNQSRGTLPGFRARRLKILDRLRRGENTPALRRAIRRYNREAHLVWSHRKLWVAVERKRLGWSPSAKIPFVWSLEEVRA